MATLKSVYDVVIVGGGHNGLVSAGYLAKAGLSVCLLERRHVLGGAAVTEEIIPGFQFSRASYLLSLLRPHIYTDLELKKHGLKLLTRDPRSYTPLSPDKWTGNVRSLTLGSDQKKNYQQIAQFSVKDAENFQKYETFIEEITKVLDPLFDIAPHDLGNLMSKKVSLREKLSLVYNNHHIRQYAYNLFTRRAEMASIYSLLTSSAHSILSSWFESEPLKATLLTDGLVGAMVSPHSPSTSYVLLHHVMGGVEGEKGAWAYPEGGMGAVSGALARAARAHGAELYTGQSVSQITLDSERKATGVVTREGIEIKAQYVLSNATLRNTLLDMIPEGTLDEKINQAVKSIDYASPVTKINVALKSIPNFLSNPNPSQNSIQPHHQASIHLNCEDMQDVVDAYEEASQGRPSTRPMIEMVIPSSLDSTLSPPGHHVCLLFTQFTPYKLSANREWTEEEEQIKPISKEDKQTSPYKLSDRDWTQEDKQAYARRVFNNIERYCPGFSSDIVGYEVLSPPDLEKEFGLSGGNIFHGALSLSQLLFNRPLPNHTPSSPFTPIPHLLLCGSGAHPGGGVCGAPGYIAAQMVNRLMRK
uniref:Pyridine nucleotide-disulfide oxidoreductase domain-containing protein 2 n=1 Tax=Cacopsylla melanoneura TaxID=428564 RepID=A0A8D8XEX2_9HEMI